MTLEGESKSVDLVFGIKAKPLLPRNDLQKKSVDLVFGIKAKLPRPQANRPQESVDLVFGIKAKPFPVPQQEQSSLLTSFLESRQSVAK